METDGVVERIRLLLARFPEDEETVRRLVATDSSFDALCHEYLEVMELLHGFEVQVKRLVTGGSDVANTILSYAADVSADFIVMGGYGHSRLREFILGGATRGVLSSMTIPTLMSH